MVTVAIFFVLLCSGSVFCAIYYQRKFEETLPITTISAILIVYLFGIFGNLLIGFYSCVAVALFLYGMSICRLIKEKNVSCFVQYFLTPAFFIYIAASTVLAITDVGMKAYIIDDFSHWADIVKVMTYLNDFGTNPAAESMFASYPPGVSIFQYIVQKIDGVLVKSNNFSEWYLFFAYPQLIIIVLMPFLKNTDLKKPLQILLLCAALFVAPLMMGRFMYRDICIDSFMGILSGAGLAMVIVWDEKDHIYSLIIWLYCAMLVLSKDIGMMFAIMLLLAYGADILMTKENKNVLYKIINIGICFFFTMVPKWLWTLEKNRGYVSEKSITSFDLSKLIPILMGKDTTYRSEVFKNYITAFFKDGFSPGYWPIKISFFGYILLFFAAYLILYKIYNRHESEKKHPRAIVLGLSFIQVIVYSFGLLFLYLFHFSKEEAMLLICMHRYLQMVMISNLVVIVIMSATAVCRWYWSRKACIVMILIIGLVCPVKEIYNAVSGVHVRDSVEYREHLEPTKKLTDTYCDNDDTIFLICQRVYQGEDATIIKFNSRPNKTIYYGVLKESQDYSPEQLQKEWMERCDYVLIFTVDDFFCEEYGELFGGSEQIKENALYAVNSQTGTLILCQ